MSETTHEGRDPGLVLADEAARLHELGFGVHWLRPNSKAPVEKGWAQGTRDDMPTLIRTLRGGYGLGVRLGAASVFPDGTYLANIDIDVKSSLKKHRDEAYRFVDSAFPGLRRHAASVITGYGLRLFFRTKAPAESKRLGASSERVKVFMPTAPVSIEQQKYMAQGLITQAELAKGMRLRPAWEVEIMGAGKQVVLPPSIHPDTKKPYVWQKPVTNVGDLPLVFDVPLAARAPSPRPGAVAAGPQVPARFNPVDVDYLDPRFAPHALRLIFGEGVEDRSAAAFSLAISMLKSGFTDDEVLSVLTDRDTYIGEMAFEHRKTDDRMNAADWAAKYCLAKAKREADAAAAFRDEPVVPAGGLSDEAAAEQTKILVREESRPWQSRLKRGGKDGDGGIKPTLENTLLIIRNMVSPEVFKRDIFGQRDFYGTPAPWTGAEVGKMLTDDDAIAIKAWLGPKFGFEPSLGVVFEAMNEIALSNGFHPVQQELLALPDWDGKPRIHGWLKRHFNAEGDDVYLDDVFRKWLIASITRTFEPGAKFDWMPILEGPQGVGKSVFGSILFGQKYFADWLPNLGDKDAALGLLGRRCVEFAELDRMRRSEVETVKAFVTRTHDVVRPPYGRKSVEYPRGVVFFGTTNRETYLQDDTGNRRFCPIKVGALDWAAIERDRDQLWAEALTYYQLGLEPSLYLEGEAARIAKMVQADKQVEDDSDAMADVLADWLEKEMAKPEDERFNLEKIKLLDLFKPMGPFGGYKYDMRTLKMAGKAIRKLGGDHWKSNGNKVWKLV
jgi:hypothetical protein